MKNNPLLHYVFLLLIVVSFASCAKSEEILFESSNNRKAITDLTTRGTDILYGVTSKDIEAYLSYKSLASKDESFKVKSVSLFPEEDPALYAINYNGYWEMVSTDKRTAPVIATGDGVFDPNTDDGGFLIWLKCLAEEISVLKKTNLQPKNSMNNLKFWGLITADKGLINALSQPTRSGPDTLYHPVPGHYELVDVEDHETIVSSINHLISTKWGQTSPYNTYCPRDANAYYNLCYAGCAPVAAGQIIYYYHYANDSCPAVYDSAYCNTLQHPNTVWSQMNQYNKSDLNWPKFQTGDSSKMAAILLANIGKGIPVRYHRTTATVIDSLRQLMDVLYDEYELESHFDYFLYPSFTCMSAYDYLYSLLDAGYPSILSAYYNLYSGHVFILDRYKYSFITNVYHYIFVPDSYQPGHPVQYEEVEYRDTLSTLRYFGMNWGLNGQYDDSWFVDSGDWIVNSLNFNYKREMLTFLNDGSYPPGSGNEEQSISPISRSNK